MGREQTAISYDNFFPKPVEERIRIFNTLSADDRAGLVRTHAQRWLALNRSRLNAEQIRVVEEVISEISPDWYCDGSDLDSAHPKAEVVARKLETVLSREDVRQFATERSDYIPAAA